MIIPPFAVHSAKSPCHQTFGNRAKYALRYFSPVGSFQNITGMEGKGLVQTSSPFSRRTGEPNSLNTSTATPSVGACSSPRYTGASGLPATKQPQMSVPPEMEARCKSDLMASYTKSKLSGARGEPVEHMVRSAESLWVSLGRQPVLRTASIYFAEVPKMVMRSS